mgnify:CR=1 FL=1
MPKNQPTPDSLGFRQVEVNVTGAREDDRSVPVTLATEHPVKVYDRQRGLLSANGNDLETQARIAAEKSIREAACQGNIMEQADDNARKQLTVFLRALGFAQITIDIPEASC